MKHRVILSLQYACQNDTLSFGFLSIRVKETFVQLLNANELNTKPSIHNWNIVDSIDFISKKTGLKSTKWNLSPKKGPTQSNQKIRNEYSRTDGNW